MTRDESDPPSPSPKSVEANAQGDVAEDRAAEGRVAEDRAGRDGGAESRISHPSHSLPRWLRAIHLVGGFVCLALGVLGIFLPLLPTTPLVLLAGYLFARGSERVHNWLLNHRYFGKFVREWQDHRRIPARAKPIAIIMVLVTFGSSMLFLPNCVYGYVLLSVIGIALLVFLATLPTPPNSVGREAD